MEKRERDSFKTPLVVEVMGGGKRFKLFCQFTYYWGETRITVPAGFVTDFASVPRIFRLIIPKLGKYNKAAVIHDFLYQNPESGRRFEVGHVKWSRKGADVVFHDAMRDLGVARWKRKVMYWGVRIFGGRAWRAKDV